MGQYEYQKENEAHQIYTYLQFYNIWKKSEFLCQLPGHQFIILKLINKEKESNMCILYKLYFEVTT